MPEISKSNLTFATFYHKSCHFLRPDFFPHPFSSLREFEEKSRSHAMIYRLIRKITISVVTMETFIIPAF